MTDKELSDLRHIAGFLLAPVLGPLVVSVLGAAAAHVFKWPFLHSVAGISVSTYFVVFPVVWLICMPIHAWFLKRRTYGYRKYVFYSLVAGALIPLAIGLGGPIGAARTDRFVWIAVCTSIALVTVSAFWLIVMWRNRYYRPQTAGRP
jgi:predicted MFS family arabinose efflux permease